MVDDLPARYRVAAVAYALAGIVTGFVVAFVVPRESTPGVPAPPLVSLFGAQVILVLFLAFWILRRVRWLTCLLAVTTGGRAAVHLLCYVMPTPLYWTVKFLPESILLADGSGHVGYLCSGAFLALGAVLLARAGWPVVRAAAPAAGATSPPPAPGSPAPQ